MQIVCYLLYINLQHNIKSILYACFLSFIFSICWKRIRKWKQILKNLKYSPIFPDHRLYLYYCRIGMTGHLYYWYVENMGSRKTGLILKSFQYYVCRKVYFCEVPGWSWTEKGLYKRRFWELYNTFTLVSPKNAKNCFSDF